MLPIGGVRSIHASPPILIIFSTVILREKSTAPLLQAMRFASVEPGLNLSLIMRRYGFKLQFVNCSQCRRPISSTPFRAAKTSKARSRTEDLVRLEYRCSIACSSSYYFSTANMDLQTLQKKAISNLTSNPTSTTP